jgi:cyclopropane fatty-acyl-phospholipid synthase-like methyltransferase
MKLYLKTEKYDADWISENWMGPNPLLLLEELCRNLDLKPDMKVLDMGCGKGLTSVFLAKEYGVTVFANDLWISATENLRRFEKAGTADKVYPINAEAHALPYANGFFDAAVSIDSYHYYGADEMYFPCTFSRLVKPGGQFGIVVPGLAREFPDGYPETMKKYWCGALSEAYPEEIGELFSFHSKSWWRHLWEKTGIARVTACYDMENPKEIWMPWAKWSREHMPELGDDVQFLADDTNDDLALIVMSAVKNK